MCSMEYGSIVATVAPYTAASPGVAPRVDCFWSAIALSSFAGRTNGAILVASSATPARGRVPSRRPAYPLSMAEDPRSEMFTDSGIELRPIYGPEDLEGFDAERDLGRPGAPPFTRGIYPTMYRGRRWTMRQYAGMATAAETNRRFRYLLEHGQTGLSVAFDLPTQMGYDSDHPRAEGEVGKTGVAIDSVEDMKTLLAEIPLDRVSTSMTINATAPILLLLYELVAEEQGVGADALSGTVQNDIL